MDLRTQLEQALIEEAQVVEHGYTLGAFNRQCHLIVTGQTDESVNSTESGHLRYEKGKGVVKTQEATCSLCITLGLNDGRWHAIQ